MAELTPEEKQRIYNEEKARLEAQERIKPEKTKKAISPTGIGCLAVLILIAVIYFAQSSCPSGKTPSQSRTKSTSQSSTQEDKSQEIAAFIQEKVNVGGFSGCVARSIGYQVVEVKLQFPAGTSRSTVEANVSGVADHFAQVGRLASTIYYRGYSGEQRVCEYKYDPFSATVKKVK